jgi:Mn2+/Fe2+ NRAMP family transporter
VGSPERASIVAGRARADHGRDDDPSGIATYSQAGAQFGLNMLWTMPLAFPLMAAIQSMCARIGRVTGKGLAAMLLGLVIQYSPISPMKALFWRAVINGVVAVPLMVVIILLVSKKSVMGPFTERRPIIVLGWIGTVVMGLAAARMIVPG